MNKEKVKLTDNQIRSYKRLSSRLIKEQIVFKVVYNDDEIQLTITPLLINNEILKLLKPWYFEVVNSAILINIKDIEV